jgi:short-subunit dehydrogenase
MVASALRRFGRLDVLVNAAGRSTRGLALDTTAAQFAQLADLNFGGVVRATQAAAPHLIAAGGHLVNIGSLASKLVSRYLGAYAATKFALAAYTAQLRLELAPQGVAVCLVCPGPIARDPSQRRYAEEASHLPPAAQKPGAGVRLRGMVAEKVAEKILTAARRRRAELVLPPAARLLSGCAAISPRLGDWIVRRMTGG